MKHCIWLFLFVWSSCSSTPSQTNKIVPPDKPKVHGHRGSRGTHPENSLPAFQEALDSGAEVLELDLHLSSDGIPMVEHDSAINPQLCKVGRRKKDKRILRLRTLTADQIQTYPCGVKQNPRFPEQKVLSTKILRLEEVLELVKKSGRSVELNIETKMDEPRPEDNPDPKMFVETVIALLRKHDLVKQSILQSFDFRTLEASKTLEPSLRISALVERDKAFCDMASAIKAEIVSPEASLVNGDRVKTCHAKGILVAPWTVNSEAEWKKLIGYGVDAIITDYPRKLVSYLEGYK